jgi:hypothetical protein
MRSRVVQVDRIDVALRSVIPCYRSPGALAGRRTGRDGKTYPAGARWEWRRIALRREAVGAILAVDPGASVRVVRDVLARYGHPVSHEQVRTDIAFAAAHPAAGLTESRRWLPLEAWLGETERRRLERSRSTPAHRSVPPALGSDVRPRSRGPRALPRPATGDAEGNEPAATAEPPARSETTIGRPATARDDWAVWNSVPPGRSRST